jgi:phospholipid-binding lipoprotein MlaA
VSPHRYLRCAGLLLLATLMGCASVGKQRAVAMGDDAIDTAPHAAMAAEHGSSARPVPAPQELIEAFPEGAEPAPSQILPEPDNAVVAASVTHRSPAPQAAVDSAADVAGQTLQPSSAYDPWEPFNRRVHRFNAAIDRALARPVANAYVAVVPTPIRKGVSNFFDNLDQPVTAVNALLQGRVRHSAEALGRFLLNSTVGVAGLFDPAARLKMRERDEDFGQTLAHWGWRRSRYLELPLFGPATLRDVLGLAADSRLQPLARLESDQLRIGLRALGLVDRRARLSSLDALREQAQDDYLLVRDSWTQRRDFQVREDASEGAALPDYLRE